jgi:hypothetical protein
VAVEAHRNHHAADRDRFVGTEIWRTLDFDPDECIRYASESQGMRLFRAALFMRIVPTLKDIGLWGKKVQDAFVNMGVIQFASIDCGEGGLADEAEADRLEKELHARAKTPGD